MLDRTQEVFDPEKIRAIRTKRGISIKQLSRKTGIQRRILQRIENESGYTFSIEVAVKIAEALECSLEEFITEGVELRLRPK